MNGKVKLVLKQLSSAFPRWSWWRVMDTTLKQAYACCCEPLGQASTWQTLFIWLLWLSLELFSDFLQILIFGSISNFPLFERSLVCLSGLPSFGREWQRKKCWGPVFCPCRWVQMEWTWGSRQRKAKGFGIKYKASISWSIFCILICE